MLYSLFAPALRGLWPPVRASQLDSLVVHAAAAYLWLAPETGLSLSLSLSFSPFFFLCPPVFELARIVSANSRVRECRESSSGSFRGKHKESNLLAKWRNGECPGASPWPKREIFCERHNWRRRNWYLPVRIYFAGVDLLNPPSSSGVMLIIALKSVPWARAPGSCLLIVSIFNYSLPLFLLLSVKSKLESSK